MKAPAIFQSYTQNILRDAVITATASPRASFDLNALGYLRPDWRVCWDTGTVTIRFTHGGGSPAEQRQGDILYIGAHNFDAGSPAAAVLTNDVGLVQPIAVPAPLGNGLCRPIVIDLTIATPDPIDRTPSYWELQVNNIANLTLGGAIAIYGPKQYLIDRDFRFGYSQRQQGLSIEHRNAYGSSFEVDLETMLRSVDVQTLATKTDADALQLFYEQCNGRRPGLLWFDPDIADAFLGKWVGEFRRTFVFDDAESIDLTFEELSRGKVIE
jgi:hypothetical protein